MTAAAAASQPRDIITDINVRLTNLERLKSKGISSALERGMLGREIAALNSGDLSDFPKLRMPTENEATRQQLKALNNRLVHIAVHSQHDRAVGFFAFCYKIGIGGGVKPLHVNIAEVRRHVEYPEPAPLATARKELQKLISDHGPKANGTYAIVEVNGKYHLLIVEPRASDGQLRVRDVKQGMQREVHAYLVWQQNGAAQETLKKDGQPGQYVALPQSEGTCNIYYRGTDPKNVQRIMALPYDPETDTVTYKGVPCKPGEAVHRENSTTHAFRADFVPVQIEVPAAVVSREGRQQQLRTIEQLQRLVSDIGGDNEAALVQRFAGAATPTRRAEELFVITTPDKGPQIGKTAEPRSNFLFVGGGKDLTAVYHLEVLPGGAIKFGARTAKDIDEFKGMLKVFTPLRDACLEKAMSSPERNVVADHKALIGSRTTEQALTDVQTPCFAIVREGDATHVVARSGTPITIDRYPLVQDARDPSKIIMNIGSSKVELPKENAVATIQTWLGGGIRPYDEVCLEISRNRLMQLRREPLTGEQQQRLKEVPEIVQMMGLASAWALVPRAGQQDTWDYIPYGVHAHPEDQLTVSLHRDGTATLTKSGEPRSLSIEKFIQIVEKERAFTDAVLKRCAEMPQTSGPGLARKLVAGGGALLAGAGKALWNAGAAVAPDVLGVARTGAAAVGRGAVDAGRAVAAGAWEVAKAGAHGVKAGAAGVAEAVVDYMGTPEGPEAPTPESRANRPRRVAAERGEMRRRQQQADAEDISPADRPPSRVAAQPTNVPEQRVEQPTRTRRAAAVQADARRRRQEADDAI